jgi:hypothetical protein
MCLSRVLPARQRLPPAVARHQHLRLHRLRRARHRVSPARFQNNFNDSAIFSS